MNHNSFSVGRVNFSSQTINGDYGSHVSARYGVEFEFFLPVNNNKWSMFLEPTYQEFEAIKDGELTFAKAKYNTIEVPLGLRYYMFLNDKSKIFINISTAFVINGDSKIELFRTSSGNLISTREINGTEEYYSLGLGYNLNNKLSLEFRYNSKRDLLGDTKFYISNFDESYSVILGYSIF
jgi:hypothetical protein